MTGCVLGFNICVSTARICNDYDHMVVIDICNFDDKKLRLVFRWQLGRQICKNLFSNEFLCTKNLIWFDSIVCTVALSSVFVSQNCKWCLDGNLAGKSVRTGLAIQLLLVRLLLHVRVQQFCFLYCKRRWQLWQVALQELV